MSFDTRSNARHPVEAKAKFCVHESMASTVKLSAQETCVVARLYDISAGGCGIDSPYLLPPETLLRIEIDAAPFAAAKEGAPTGQIKTTGIVRSCIMRSVGHYRLGIRFTEIKEEDANFISAFIKTVDQRKTQRWNLSQ